MSQTKIKAGGFDVDVITGTTALGATPADTDELLLSDAGTLKRVDYSYLKDGAGLVLTGSSVSSTAASAITITNCFSSTYQNYLLVDGGVKNNVPVNIWFNPSHSCFIQFLVNKNRQFILLKLLIDINISLFGFFKFL